MTCIGNFLIRIKNDCFHTVCRYEKPNTLIRQYGISSYRYERADPRIPAAARPDVGALGTAHPRARNRARPNARARFARATRDERRASFFFARRRRPRRARVDGDSASTADASRSIDRGFVREG